jgi:hypothetical protein
MRMIRYDRFLMGLSGKLFSGCLTGWVAELSLSIRFSLPHLPCYIRSQSGFTPHYHRLISLALETGVRPIPVVIEFLALRPSGSAMVW